MQTVARRSRRTVLAAPAAALLAALVLAGPASAAHAPTLSQAPGAGAQGLIMKDGNICDPIRHMGC